MKKVLVVLAGVAFFASMVYAQGPAPASEKKIEPAKPAAAKPAATPAAARQPVKPGAVNEVAHKDRGGVMGFIAGCCFGVRAAAAYNDGKDIHWREWITLVPFVCIWNGIEGASGKNTRDYVTMYGTRFY